MSQKLTVVVTGSTGKQGGVVARGLLERGHMVRAVTRDPNSRMRASSGVSGSISQRPSSSNNRSHCLS